LGVPLVRFVSAAQSPQITDLKLSTQNACYIYYHSRKKQLCGSPKIGRIGKKWEVADGHIRLAINAFDFLNTAIYGRFPLLLTIIYLQYLLYILFFFEREDKQEVVDRDNILKVCKWEYMCKWVDRIVGNRQVFMSHYHLLRLLGSPCHISGGARRKGEAGREAQLRQY
jgi:hypothetical protein